MQELNLPAYSVKLKTVSQQSQIFDEVRKKWLVLTPEEWVRQHVIHFLFNSHHYPLNLMGVEQELKLNNMKRRTDLVVYSNTGAAKMIIECKAPNVKIDQKTLDQAARYNLVLKVPYLMITNGMNHYVLHINDKGDAEYVNSLPSFEVLCG